MAIAKPQTPTIIDTISAGYRIINRSPWVLLMPILVNLYLWLSPAVQFATDRLSSRLPEQAAGLTTEQIQLGTELQQWLQALSLLDLRQPLALLNYMPLLSLNVLHMGAPTEQTALPALQAATLRPELRGEGVLLQNGGQLLLAALVINGLALCLSSGFLVMLAQPLQGAASPLRRLPGQIGGVALRLLGWNLLVVTVVLLFGVPLLCGVGIVALASPPLASLLATLIYSVWVWLQIAIGFAIESMVLDGSTPIRATLLSISLVRSFFWSSIVLVLLSTLIQAGLQFVWQILIDMQYGIWIAIIASAYISSGLVAARFVFYRERQRGLLLSL